MSVFTGSVHHRCQPRRNRARKQTPACQRITKTAREIQHVLQSVNLPSSSVCLYYTPLSFFCQEKTSAWANQYTTYGGLFGLNQSRTGRQKITSTPVDATASAEAFALIAALTIANLPSATSTKASAPSAFFTFSAHLGQPEIK